MLAVQMIVTVIGTEEITQPTLNYAAQLLQHLHSMRLGDHKHGANSHANIEVMFSHGKGGKSRSGTNYISHEDHLLLLISPTRLPP